jgi:hypothetical protein
MTAPARVLEVVPTPPSPSPPPLPPGEAEGRAAGVPGGFRRVVLDPRAPYLVPFLLLVAARAWFWRQFPYASEDAYITFRYARHLVEGYGLTYNPGERVMGFTSPLWTLWNALGYALTRDPVLWSRASACAADLVTLAGLTWLLERHASRASAWCFAVFFAAWPYFSAVTVSGMENGVLVALVVLAAVLLERRRGAAGPVLAAAALMRPEGVVAALVLALRARARERLAALGLAAAGLAALGAYYGTIVPQSVHAKASIYGTPGPWSGRHWWDWFVPFPLGDWPVTSEGSALFAMAVVTAPAAVLGAAALGRARHTAPAVAVAALVAVWLGYAALGVAYFYWYLVVPLVGVAVLAAVGLPRLVRSRAAYAALALFVAGTWTIVPGLYQARAAAEYLGFAGTAKYLAANARTGEKVMLEPIGIVGYFNRLVVVDEVGLVSPRVAERRREGAGWMADTIARERPEWLVVRRSALDQAAGFAGAGAPFRSTAERDSTLAGYRLAEEVFAEAGANRLTIWRRTR